MAKMVSHHVGNGPIDAPYIAARYCLGSPFLASVLSLSFARLSCTPRGPISRFERHPLRGDETRLSNSVVLRYVTARKRTEENRDFFESTIPFSSLLFFIT